MPEKGEIEEAVIGSMDSSNLEFWAVRSEKTFWCRFETLVLLAQLGKNRLKEPFHYRNSRKFFGRDWCICLLDFACVLATLLQCTECETPFYISHSCRLGRNVWEHVHYNVACPFPQPCSISTFVLEYVPCVSLSCTAFPSLAAVVHCSCARKMDVA